MSDTATPYPNDEISLRDLYLILRKGFLLITTVSLGAAILAFIVLSLQPASYEAESTALVTPPAIRIERVQNLTFTPNSEVTFEAYETLAESRSVLETTVNAVPAAELEYQELNGTVSKLVGPDRPGQSTALLVTHTVRHRDADTAAALANAWASTTLETVSASLLANIAPLSETTQAEFAALEARLLAAEEALATFEAGDQSLRLEETTSQLASLIADSEATLSSDSELQLGSNMSGNRNQAIIGRGYTNLPQAIAATEARLGTFEREGLTAEASQESARLAGLRARLASLSEQLADYQQRYDEAQREFASALQTRRHLERDLSNAETAYQAVANLRPFIDYAAALSPSNTSLLSQAAVPTETANSSRLLGSLIVLVLAAMLMTLFVFLREAVQRP